MIAEAAAVALLLTGGGAGEGSLAGAAATPPTIPALREWHSRGRDFVPGAGTRVLVEPRYARRLEADAQLFARELGQLLGRRPAVLPGGSESALPADVRLTLGARDRRLGREGYALESGAGLSISARTAAGAFYGTRTVLQLLRARRSIPGGRARDWPRYPHRGLMVDNGRKFFTPRWLRRQVRELAYLKLNVLHLHLSDNEGFRIESQSHPEIVSRAHLTKRQVRALVSYAARHHVTVIPEIDAPGHMRAALARHPGLQLHDPAGAARVDKLDVTLPAARRFVRDLIEEYLPLFPARYWHTGADEYMPEGDYARYPQLLRHARQAYGPRASHKDAYLGFVNWVERLVRARGRRLRAWSDGLHGGSAVRVSPRVDLEWWFPFGRSPRRIVADGHRILNAGWFPTYYVVGPLGKDRPDMARAYRDWRPHIFAKPFEPGTVDRLAASSRRLQGSELHVWNDDPRGESEDEIARGIAPRLSVLAQKTWGSPPLTPSYRRFQALERALGNAPSP